MNFIAFLFLLMALAIFVPGLLINYGRAGMVPGVVVRFFQYGRANISLLGSQYSSLRKIEVSKRWFWHFYLWAVGFHAIVTFTVLRAHYYGTPTSAWLVTIMTTLTGNSQGPLVPVTITTISCLLLQVHLIRRLFETLFIAVYSPKSKMNIAHYLLGYTHYTLTTLALISCSPGLTVHQDYKSNEGGGFSIFEIKLPQVIGIALFFYGNILQFRVHKELGDMRRGKDGKVVTLEHKIPSHHLFSLISSPNYWAEMLIYVGLMFVMGMKNVTWNYCTLWVVANQIISGVMNHHWYLQKFGDAYPKDRKAVIPYIW